MTETMTVTTKEQAWAKVNEIFPTDYEKDWGSSERAGYDIYRHPTLNYFNRICDLGDRLEVLTGEHGEIVTNIWIVAEKKMVETRKLYSEDLRRLCIRHNWYTKGTNDEYIPLLNAVDKLENVTTEEIANIAENILRYSDTDYPLVAICFEIAEICHSYFE